VRRKALLYWDRLYVNDAYLFVPNNGPSAQTEHSEWFTNWGSYCYRIGNPTCKCGATQDQNGGDSGSPVFVLINNQLVLVGPWDDCELPTWPGQYTSKLNTVITSLDTYVGHMTGDTVSTYDLSAFPDLW
jgi:hypothetical protein